jgi:LacI family transcriptional regulator
MPLDRKNRQPVYRQIYDILIAEINNGLYNKAGMLPTEKELCERFGVERNTLRKALQILVEEDRIIRRRGSGTKLLYPYSPVQKAVIQINGQAYNNSVLFVAQEDYLSEGDVESFHYKLINSFDKKLSEHGLHLIYKSVGRSGFITDAIRSLSPAAVIFDSFIHNSFHREALQFSAFCISVNHYTPLMTSVVSNNYEGAYQVAKSLTDAGHERIALLLGKRNHQTCIERLSGFQSLCMSRGIQIDEQYMYSGNWLFASGADTAEIIADLPPDKRPTAVFAFNDDMAYGCYNGLRLRGLSVPGDISVVGFDRSDRYISMFPPLTTVDVNMDAIVDYTCWVLANSLSGKSPKVNAKIQLDVRLVDNGSIGSV